MKQILFIIVILFMVLLGIVSGYQNGTTDLNIIEKIAKVLGVKVMDLRGD